MRTGSVTTAVDPEIMRDLVELSFIEDYGWTPQYISTLSYKWIQKHNYMRRIKHAAQDTQRQQQKFKQQMANQPKPGQKTWQEIS